MSVLQKILDTLPEQNERRRFQRVRVNLLGRYMLADRREYPCQIQDMSPGGMALVAPVSGKPGERVVAYVDHLGRLEGTVVRVYPDGFSMTTSAVRKRGRPRRFRRVGAGPSAISLIFRARGPRCGLAGRTAAAPGVLPTFIF